MKNQLSLCIAAGLGFALSLSLLSFKSSEPPYYYDSVKLSSADQFNHAASATAAAYARVVYPVFQDKDLNNIITNEVLSPLKVKYDFKNTFAAEHPALSNMDAITNGAINYNELARNFLQQFETQAPKMEPKAYWYADIKVKVLADKPGYTVISCDKDYFTGGVHDLYDHSYLNYDKKTHQLITLDSQLKANAQNQLKVIAERIFRKNEGLTATQELDGYFFKDEKFDLPDNFTITDKGLLFFYNYYEIKPFAAGTTQLIIPFAELKNIVSPDSILAAQKHKQ